MKIKCDICDSDFTYESTNFNYLVIANDNPQKGFNKLNNARTYYCCMNCMSDFMTYLYTKQGE
jgi:hypothetical protein